MKKTKNTGLFRAKTVAVILAAAMIAAPVHTVTYATDTSPAEQEISDLQFTYPQQHSFAEINQYVADHPYDVDLEDKYDIQPDIANEEINARIGSDTLALYGNEEQKKADRDALVGKLSQETLDNALNASNFMRYSAGLQLLYIHTNDLIGGYQWRAQASSAILAELGVITHNVSNTDARAAGIADGVYGWAKAGPGGANIVAGYGVANKVVNSFMPDIGNDKTGLSHRSFILNPGLSGTGFGAARLNGTTNKAGNPRGSAVSMFVTYYGADPNGIDAVMWPAARQPIETFLARGLVNLNYPADNPYQGNPWSFFFNKGSVDTSKLKVTLECDGKPTEVLEFSKLTDTERSTNRLFTIASNPLKNLIAWRPYNVYTSGDKVNVTIEGIVDSQGLPIPVNYDVHFFQTGTEPHPDLEHIYTDRLTAHEAEFKFNSDYDGTMHYLVLEADQQEPTAADVLNGTEIDISAGENKLELTGLSGNGAKKLYYITSSSTAAGKDHAAAAKSGEMSAVTGVEISENQLLVPTVTPPTANTLTYNGTAQELITAGITNGGTLEYRLGDSASYSTAIPTATDAGEYTIWYRVVKDETYDGTNAQSITVSIAKARVTAAAKDYSIQTGDKVPDLSTPAVGEHYTADGLFGDDALGGSAVLTYEKDGTAVTPDTSKAGTYDIVLSGVTEPENGNYEPITLKNGTLTITTRPTAGGNSGSSGGGNGGSSSSGSSTSAGTSDSKSEQITADENSFADVKSDDYFYDAVKWAVANKVTEGTGKDTFSPDMSCTRAQMVTFLWRAAGSPEAGDTKNTFSDVDPDAYYYDAVLWAVRNGITKGVSADMFSPESIVNRGQTIAFLYRAAGTPTVDNDSVFNDVEAGAYYAGAVAWAVHNGITSGTGNGAFSPDEDCTRGQIVTLLYRANR